jgi:predicted GNAT superfamily acetyltransferase
VEPTVKAAGAVVRDLRADDHEAALAINEANTPAVGTLDAERFGHLAGQCAIALAAEVSNDLAGFCLVLSPGADYGSVNYGWFAARYDDFAYLDRVAVDERHRNRGIGAALYAEVERRTAARLFLLEVNLRPRNDGSLRFHHRLGFREVGQQETPYGARVSMLAKDLAPAAAGC